MQTLISTLLREPTFELFLGILPTMKWTRQPSETLTVSLRLTRAALLKACDCCFELLKGGVWFQVVQTPPTFAEPADKLLGLQQECFVELLVG